ncbi:MAG: DNA polymerase III subunit gamma/tau [Eubacteriaceae bacterium]|nr:DNA polymerase III subunit gamma/tau [Eubacteriaceae bacterium]
MEYVALYRRYRPKEFREMIGQENIVTILKNQIIMDKIAHAYLFSGTRGTGKTSAAKIFARAVNCENNSQGEPCNTCESCINLESNSVMDIIEIDAASNRGVDEIRELRDKVKYLPSMGKYKVYIIDEVHMLTMEAFNALLKTLEEPPSHAIFILATTEPNKLPATILSRCQRFNFKRISAEDIIKQLLYVCKDIDVEIEDAAVKLIAKNADGAMRDALSILDQCMSISRDNIIEYEEVKTILGITDNQIVYSIIEAILDWDVKKALVNLDIAYNMGKEMTQLIDQLALALRDILIYKITGNADLMVEIRDEESEILKKVQLDDLEKISEYIEILADRENKIKFSSLPKILMEVTLIKLCTWTKPEKAAAGVREERGSYQAVKKEPALERAQILQTSQKPSAPPEKAAVKEDTAEAGKPFSWNQAVKEISKEKPLLGMSLGPGKAKIENKKILLYYDEANKFHYDAILKEKEQITKIVRKLFGDDAGFDVKLRENDSEFFMKTLPLEIFGEDKVDFIK